MATFSRPNPSAARDASIAAFKALYAAMDEQADKIPCVADGPAVWDAKRTTLQKRMCGKCPVQELCFRAGQSSDGATGVWGGVWFGKPEEGKRK